jgi:hypothetical protein
VAATALEFGYGGLQEILYNVAVMWIWPFTNTKQLLPYTGRLLRTATTASLLWIGEILHNAAVMWIYIHHNKQLAHTGRLL